MAPPAGNGAELQFALAPFQAPEFAGLKLMLQVLAGLGVKAEIAKGGFHKIAVTFGLGKGTRVSS